MARAAPTETAIATATGTAARRASSPRLPDGLRDVLWLVPGMIMLGALFIAPIAHVVWISLTSPSPGLDNYRSVVSDPIYVRVLANTAVSAVGATIGCLLLGYPTAYAIYRANGRLRAAMLGVVLFSYAVGTIPRAFSWLVVLGDRGLVNQALRSAFDLKQPLHLIYNQTGVLIGMIHVMLPFMTLILLGSMMRVGRQLVPAARTLGASPVQAFWLVFLPLTSPGILAGTMLILVYSLGFYVVPAVLGGASETTIVMAIRDLALNLGLWGLGSALATVVVAISIVGAAIYVRTTGLAHTYDRD